MKISGHLLSQNNCSGWPDPHNDNAIIGVSYMRYGEKLDPSVAINSWIWMGQSLETLH